MAFPIKPIMAGLGGALTLLGQHAAGENANKDMQTQNKANQTVAHNRGRIGAGIFEQMGLVDRAGSKDLTQQAAQRAVNPLPYSGSASLLGELGGALMEGGMPRPQSGGFDWEMIQRLLEGGGGTDTPATLPPGRNYFDLFSNPRG